MKYFALILFFIFVSCSDEIKNDGTIMFTSNENCEFKIYTVSNGKFISSGIYELEKNPTVIYIKNADLYIIHAETYNSKKTYKKPVHFNGGILEYFIEF